ncbi:MAG: hypothetical protein V2I48_04995, partial [Xanthomonadales bacterium]|nr:hypothetical protein [Xanthomonadales bacterium]
MEADKKALLKQVSARLQKDLKVRWADIVKPYLEQCFRRVPLEELAGSTPARLAAIVAGQIRFIQQRRPGQLLVRVFNPSMEKDGWESDHSVVQLANDDKPFLVDSAALALSEMDIGIHLVVHPVLRVGRNSKGQLEKIHPRGVKDGKAESFIQFHIDKRAAEADLEQIEQRLVDVMSDVNKAVCDWHAMD